MSDGTSRDLVRGSGLPEHEAVRLLMSVTGKSRTDLLLGTPISEADADGFLRLEQARLGGQPLQYLEGSVSFGPVEIAVDDRVLVPRPETELLLEIIPQKIDQPSVIVDLCTGSGNLAIALAATYPNADVFATDLSEDALAVAAGNAESNGVAVAFGHGDLFAPLPARIKGHVDLLVANPPYLAEAEYRSLPDDVKREPKGALVAGDIGDEVLERIAGQAGTWLSVGGLVICEISEFHGAAILEHFGPLDGTLLQDLSGKDRFVIGHRRVE